jgi:hypothetical protein
LLPKSQIPPTAVGGSFQMLSTRDLHRSVGIPPTVVGGLFKSFLRKDLKYPPTAVGGINVQFRDICRKDLNQSTHCRGWDLGLLCEAMEGTAWMYR